MRIKLLSPSTVIRIAAGEVIERPSSVVKELVENSIDAGAKLITVITERGGRNFIEVVDDGCGVHREDMKMAFVKNATSKLDEDDLSNIKMLGFRGEALASIAAVSQVSLISKRPEDEYGLKISCESGKISTDCTPATSGNGTTISVRNLFCHTPARLKFLQSEKIENQQITEIIKAEAISHSDIEFKLFVDGKLKMHCKAASKKQRFADILKISDIRDDIFDIRFTVDTIHINGYLASPSHFTSRSTSDIYTFINSRVIKNQNIYKLIKHACFSVIEKGKFPKIAFFIETPLSEIDVNVHPNKLDVRFKNQKALNAAVMRGIQNALQQTVITRYASTDEDKINILPLVQSHFATTKFPELKEKINRDSLQSTYSTSYEPPKDITFIKKPPEIAAKKELAQEVEKEKNLTEFENFTLNYLSSDNNTETKKMPLGAAICQIGKKYIISETENELIITDQHAAHERIIYEELKKHIFKPEESVTQKLLIPETVIIQDSDSEELINVTIKELKKFGFQLTKKDTKTLLINEKPCIFGNVTCSELIDSCISSIYTYGNVFPVEEKFHEIAAKISCYNSIRAGQAMSKHEMNALLRKIESTQHAGQCNHGRPSYIKFGFGELDAMFNRS